MQSSSQRLEKAAKIATFLQEKVDNAIQNQLPEWEAQLQQNKTLGSDEIEQRLQLKKMHFQQLFIDEMRKKLQQSQGSNESAGQVVSATKRL